MRCEAKTVRGTQCKNKAKYHCGNCHEYRCVNHVKTKPTKGNKLYCSVCGYKVYPIEKVFIGSREPMLKFSPLRKFWKKPRIFHKGKPYQGNETYEEKE